MSLAIFDLDNTLINGDSDHAWGEFLCQNGIVDKDEYQQANDYFYQNYQNGDLDIEEYLNFALQPLAKHNLEQLQIWQQEFMQTVIKPMLLPKAQALLDKHRAAEDYLLIITATNRFVTEPIAQLLGVDELLATEPERNETGYTGKVKGTACFQEGKVQNLEKWLADSGQNLAGSYFYSDSHNDLPLLERVDQPIAVNPDTKLAAIATEHGWPILDLR